MNDGGPHIVVAVMRAMRDFVAMLFEFQFAFMLLALLHHANLGKEGMRFRNLVTRFQISTPVLEREQLAAAIRPDGLDADIGSLQELGAICPHAKARRRVVFQDLDVDLTGAQLDATRFLAMIMVMTVRVTMAVTVMMPAGQ